MADLDLTGVIAVKVENNNGVVTSLSKTDHGYGWAKLDKMNSLKFNLYKSNVEYTLKAGNSITFKTETSEKALYYLNLSKLDNINTSVIEEDTE